MQVAVTGVSVEFAFLLFVLGWPSGPATPPPSCHMSQPSWCAPMSATRSFAVRLCLISWATYGVELSASGTSAPRSWLGLWSSQSKTYPWNMIYPLQLHNRSHICVQKRQVAVDNMLGQNCPFLISMPVVNGYVTAPEFKRRVWLAPRKCLLNHPKHWKNYWR